MKKNMIAAVVMIGGLAHADIATFTQWALLRGGQYTNVAQSVGTTLAMKDSAISSGGARVSMMKADISGISDTVDSATFTYRLKNTATANVDATFYVYAVVDGNAYDSTWTGDSGGNATWNSVLANGLFTPGLNLAMQSDSQLVEIGSVFVAGQTGYTDYAFSGAGLVSALNADTDGILTLAFTSDVSQNGQAFKSPEDSAAPSLEYTVIPEPATLGLVAFAGAALLFVRRKFMV